MSVNVVVDALRWPTCRRHELWVDVYRLELDLDCERERERECRERRERAFGLGDLLDIMLRSMTNKPRLKSPCKKTEHKKLS
jgi:hypothetical protein